MPGADENERVKRLYSKALMGSNAFHDLIRDMVDAPPSPFMSIIDRMQPPRTEENRGGDAFPMTVNSRRPGGGKSTGLIETARNFFKKQPTTTPPPRSNPYSMGARVEFSYADDSRPIRGLRSDLIMLDEVQDMVDDFSLIERPVSPIIRDRPTWDDRLLGAFKDMQDSTLYRQEIMGTWPKEEPPAPVGGRPYFPREDVIRAYQQGLVSRETMMTQLNIAVPKPEPNVSVPRIVRKEIKSEEFIKSKFELMAYQSDVRKILAENVLKDMEEQEGRDMAMIAAQIAMSRPAPKPVIAPVVNPDYGDAYRVIEAGRLGGRTPRKTSWRTMDSILLRRPRVKVNLQPELGPGSTQAPKIRAYSAISESRNEPYVYIPELVGDRWCPHCREPVKMSQDMDRPGGQRVLCGECWSLKKTDRTAYEARIKRMPPTPTNKLGTPVYQCLTRPNLP